jgi:hypothetical protein
MSIDARIELVTYEADGTATLHLGPRDKRNGPGQPSLTVLNPSPGMEVMEGMEIWGGASSIVVGETVWAERIGYTSIRWKEPKERSRDNGQEEESQEA